jgi:hypothetical protein
VVDARSSLATGAQRVASTRLIAISIVFVSQSALIDVQPAGCTWPACEEDRRVSRLEPMLARRSSSGEDPSAHVLDGESSLLHGDRHVAVGRGRADRDEHAALLHDAEDLVPDLLRRQHVPGLAKNAMWRIAGHAVERLSGVTLEDVGGVAALDLKLAVRSGSERIVVQAIRLAPIPHRDPRRMRSSGRFRDGTILSLGLGRYCHRRWMQRCYGRDDLTAVTALASVVATPFASRSCEPSVDVSPSAEPAVESGDTSLPIARGSAPRPAAPLRARVAARVAARSFPECPRGTWRAMLPPRRFLARAA